MSQVNFLVLLSNN